MPGMSLTTLGLGLGMFGGAGAQSYTDKVLATQSANLVAYWPLSETSGTVADNAEGTAGRDGTYSNVTLADGTFPNGDPVPLLVPASSSYVNIYSADLASNFDGDEGTLMVWAKVRDASVWTDGTQREIGIVFGGGFVTINKQTTDNLVRFRRQSTAVQSVDSTDAGGITDFVQFVMTWSVANDELKAYINGAQVGTTQTGLETWAESLSSTRTLVGASNSSPVSGVWDGWVGHAAIWSTPLTAQEVAALYPFDLPDSVFLSFGDSKTDEDAYQPTLLSNLNAAGSDTWGEIAEMGRDGYTAALWQAQIDTDLALMTRAPDYILVNLGTNDVEPTADPLVQAEWEADFAYILDAFHTKWPDATVLVAQIWRRFDNGQMSDLNDTWIPNVLSTRAWASLGIDERTFLEGGDDGATYTSDGIHPNEAGYELMAQEWQTAMGY